MLDLNQVSFASTGITGDLNCNGSPISTAVASVNFDGHISYHYLNAPFELNLQNSCNSSNGIIEITFFRPGTNGTLESTILLSGENYQLGSIDVCRDESEEFFKFRSPGNSDEVYFDQPFAYTYDFLDLGYTQLVGLSPNLRIELNFQDIITGDYSGQMDYNGSNIFKNHAYFEQNGFGFDGFLDVVQITRYDSFGGFIEGFFSGTVYERVDYNANNPKKISGNFRIKRKAELEDESYSEFVSEGYRFVEPNVHGKVDEMENVFTSINTGVDNLDSILIMFYGIEAGDYSDQMNLGQRNEVRHNMEEINWELIEPSLNEFIITDFGEVGDYVRGYWTDEVLRNDFSNSATYPARGSFAILRVE